MRKVVKFIVIFAIILISVIIIKKDDELTVCIDAGHGGIDVGAVNDVRYEKEDNLKIEKLVKKYLEELTKTDIQTNRGVKSGTAKGENTDYYVLKNTKMPSCLIELGFISNDKDNNLFDENLENYAKAIADGIIEEIKDELNGK